MATLIDGLVHGLPAPSRKALVARAEGVPLFAVETVRVLIDRDLVVPRDGRYVPAGGAELDLEAIGAPASLQALVAARLDALTPEERRVVADASVLGLSFTLDGLLSLGSDPQTLDALLASLVRKEIVALQTDRFTAERGHYRFVQTVVRQIAYGTQSKRDRKARHLAAADYVAALPDPGEDLAVVVAQHLLDAVAAAPNGDPDVPDLVARACMDLERAATRARTVGAPAEAQNLLETALTHVSDPADQARLHLAAALAASDVGHDAESSSHAETAAALFDAAGDAIRAGQAAAQHARAMVNMGDNAAAIAISEARWRALEHVPGTEPALLALGLPLSVAHGRISQWDQQRFYAEKRLLLGEALDEPEAVASGHVGLAIRYAFLGAPLSALMSYRNAAGIARDHDLPAPLAMALNNVGATLNSRDLTSALVNAEEAIEVARRAGLKTMTEWAISTRMSGLWAAGRYREVAALLAEVGDSVSDLVFRVFLNTLEAWLAAAQGNPIPPAPAELPDSDEESALAIRDCAEITRALAAGDPTTAARLAERSFDHLLAAQGLEDDFSLLWPHFVLAALAADDLDLADRLLEPVTRALPGRRSPAVAAHWHRFRGLVAAARGDDPDFAETELRAGIDGLDAYGALGYRAQAQDELARWLVDQHRQEEAEPFIDAARATYAEIGATGWLANLDAWHASTKAVAR